MKKFERWTVAYRPRTNGDTLLNNTSAAFSVIRNSWRYWAGDPHLLEFDGKTYVFAEVYDRILRRGLIGYSIIDDNGASAWKIALSMPHHLSYPHLIEHSGSVYMIPESYVANEIAVYRAVSFPDKWEKVKVLKSDYCAVDSTLLQRGDENYLLTLRFDGDDEKLMLYAFRDSELSEKGYCAAINDPNKRPAGHFFTFDGGLYRPAQDCTESYGCALNFYRVTKADNENYDEELIKKIFPADLQTDLGVTSDGLHTYNMNEKYEVIDLKEYETDPLFYIMRPIWFIWRRIKRLFKR